MEDKENPVTPNCSSDVGGCFENVTFEWNDTTANETAQPDLPIDMYFNSGHAMSITAYTILFIFSAIGNITVLTVLLKRRRGKLIPMDFLLLHLVIADLMVTFLMMPLEIAWNATVYWRGGDFLCRIMSFFRIFGLFLSSFVLVSLAVDRYMAIKYPMQSLAGVKRSRIMIAISWILSILCSSPQVVFFRVETHPVFTWYTQCVVFSSLSTKAQALAYFLFGMFFTYLGPFIVLLALYGGIVFELIRRHKESTREMRNGHEGGMRRSGVGNLEKAKEQALKMTVIIALIFFVCWTPYYAISLWYFIDETSFLKLDPRINKAMFFFACANSTANPVVYGIFNLRSRGGFHRRHGTISHGQSMGGATLLYHRQRQLQSNCSQSQPNLMPGSMENHSRHINTRNFNRAHRSLSPVISNEVSPLRKIENQTHLTSRTHAVQLPASTSAIIGSYV